jgi:hypothetical protein
MIKKDVIKLAKRASRLGYMTHLMLLEIYKDDEEISREFVRLVIHKPEPRKYIFTYWSKEGAEQFHKAIQEAAKEYITKK